MDKHVKEYRKQVNQTSVTSKGQLTLPKRVRDALGLKPGDTVRFFIHGNEVLVAAVRPIGDSFGMLAYDGPPISVEEMDRAVAEKGPVYGEGGE